MSNGNGNGNQAKLPRIVIDFQSGTVNISKIATANCNQMQLWVAAAFLTRMANQMQDEQDRLRNQQSGEIMIPPPGFHLE